MKNIIIPKELENFRAEWTFNSLEFTNSVAHADGWLDYALKILYGDKAITLKENVIQRLEDGKYTKKKLIQYENAIANNCRDIRYLSPYFLVTYFVAKNRAEKFYSEGLIAQAFSTLSLMYFCAGSLVERAESERGATTAYMEDPIRIDTATTAANATHAGSKVVQDKVIELIKSKDPKDGWTTRKAAATAIEKSIIELFYIPNPDISKRNGDTYIPRPGLDFSLNLQASALHDRILKWMGKGLEGVTPIHQAITAALKQKLK
jgi:hypothetical protein